MKTLTINGTVFCRYRVSKDILYIQSSLVKMQFQRHDYEYKIYHNLIQEIENKKFPRWAETNFD